VLDGRQLVSGEHDEPVTVRAYSVVFGRKLIDLAQPITNSYRLLAPRSQAQETS
jgi:hypothetical protein